MANVYTIQQLAEQSSVAGRTLRQWVRLKLLPKPVGRGRAAHYDDRHLVRAKAVRHLRGLDVSVPEIRDRLALLSESEIAGLVPPPKPADGLPVAPPEPTYPFAMWEMVQIMDGLALMVNPARGPALRRIANEIYRHYRGPVTARG